MHSNVLLFIWALPTLALGRTSDGNNDRVIYIYKTEGCQVQTPSGSITLQSADAREETIKEINHRVEDLLHQKYPVKLSENSDTSSSRTKVESKYLSALQFEVTTIPEGITESEMISISSELPCVEQVARDGVKTADQPSLTDQLLRAEGLENNRWGDLESEPRSLGVTPSDPFLMKQWSLLNQNHWGIRAQDAWSDSTGHEFVVAVIDSGCDLHHPEIQGKLWVNKGELDCYNGVDDDGNGYIDDCYGWDWVDNDNNPSPRASGHGTGAAGIIASATNNAVGIAGICWFCQIMCLRFISGTEGQISNQVAAIDYAVKNGARISNNSYGGYGYSALEYRAIERAKMYGHLFVASAGNNNLNTDDKANDHTPSVYNLDNILAVGASTQHGAKAAFSNYGQNSVDVYAPGSSIQTVADGGRYAVVSGTSFAAPMAAGTAALIWSEYPGLSYQQVKESVVSTCKLSPRLARKASCGGVLDAAAGMERARELAQSLDDPEVEEGKGSMSYVIPGGGENEHSDFDWHSSTPPEQYVGGGPDSEVQIHDLGNVRQEPHLSHPSTGGSYDSYYSDYSGHASTPFDQFAPLYSGGSTPYGLGIFGRLFGMGFSGGQEDEVSYAASGARTVETHEDGPSGKKLLGGGILGGSDGIAQTIGSLSGGHGNLLGPLSRVAGISGPPRHLQAYNYQGYDTQLNGGGGFIDAGMANIGGVPQAARQAMGALINRAPVSVGRQSSSQIGSVVNGLMSSMTNTVGGARQRFGQ